MRSIANPEDGACLIESMQCAHDVCLQHGMQEDRSVAMMMTRFMGLMSVWTLTNAGNGRAERQRTSVTATGSKRSRGSFEGLRT